jgi:hypothetical protein
LSGDQDYKLISGHVVYRERGWFPGKVPHRKMVKLLIDKKKVTIYKTRFTESRIQLGSK